MKQGAYSIGVIGFLAGFNTSIKEVTNLISLYQVSTAVICVEMCVCLSCTYGNLLEEGVKMHFAP